jgi:hypothetical protein
VSKNRSGPWLVDPHERRAEARVFLWHLRALIVPGCDVPVFDVHPRIGLNAPKGWNDDDFQLLIEGGRRQVDRQRADLTHIRTQAQFLFTTTVAVLLVLLAGLHRIARSESIATMVLWGLGVAASVAGLLGAGAVMVAKGQFGIINASLVPGLQSPVRRGLALSYSRIVALGENTVATRQTVLRDAAALVTLGGVVHAIVWISTAG